MTDSPKNIIGLVFYPINRNVIEVEPWKELEPMPESEARIQHLHQDAWFLPSTYHTWQ